MKSLAENKQPLTGQLDMEILANSRKVLKAIPQATSIITMKILPLDSMLPPCSGGGDLCGVAQHRGKFLIFGEM